MKYAKTYNHNKSIAVFYPSDRSVLDGVMPGVVAIEHGYGHREMGARTHWLDGVMMASDPRIGQGSNLNDLGFTDPTREVPNTWLDWVSGAAVRQGLPAKLDVIS